ncbi:recombination protein RecO [Nautilia lithotrophica]
MKGFILNTIRVRDEDLIVRILTESEVISLYRFYGARHSYINVGYLIDFYIEETAKTTIKRLRHVTQIPFKFLFDMQKTLYFKEYIRLLNKHFIDVSRVDKFYYNSLYKLCETLHERDVKRAVIEHYVSLLEKEGRLHNDFICFLCEKVVEQKVALARSFLPAHEKCIMSSGFEKEKLKLLFNEKKTLLFSDEEIDKLWKILELGI